jgi:hypothetical protein
MSKDVTITISIGTGAEVVTVGQAGADEGQAPLSLEALGAAEAVSAGGEEAPAPLPLEQLGAAGAAAEEGGAPAPLELDALGDSEGGQAGAAVAGSPPEPGDLKAPPDAD